MPFVGAVTGLLVAVGRGGGAVLAGLDVDRDGGRRCSWSGSSLEGYVLSPKLVGDNVGLHPVWLMFALFAFGYLFGFVGLLIAMPLAAAIGVLFRFGLRRYLASPIYTGRGVRLTRRRMACRSKCPRQLALALDHAESFAREDFLAGPCNAAALALIERWPDWPARRSPWSGPRAPARAIWPRSGPATAGARFLAARALATAPLPAALATGALVVEDLAAGQFDERALFHLLNLAREERAYRADHARAPRPAAGGSRCPISPRGSARCRWWR